TRSGVRTSELSRVPLPATGETFVTGLPPGAVCTAAVGALGLRFVAVAHAPPAETPPAAPSAEVSLAVRSLRHPATSGGDVDAPELLVGAERDQRLAEAARAQALEADEAAVPGGSPTSPGGAPSSSALR